MYYCASYELCGTKLTPDVRFMNIKTTRAGRRRRLMSYLLRRRGDPVAAYPVDQLGSLCFGRVGKHDQLALEGFIAGQEPSAYRRPLERPHRDRTDPTG
jgi:hypothetical protein